ncbi:MAG: hypothetical protein DDT37_01783 [Firmicutes bacterium]|nr:hypothetical protein [candidate division NPL-UPA2 bacterium]
MYIERAVEPVIKRLTGMFGVLLVTGPRQVGKTTLLQKLSGPERKYVTLDDPDVRLLAKTDPSLFLQRFSPPVIIDEIQYAPELLPYIKMHIDTTRRRGEFWLTGSQTFHTMKDVNESLAGRVGIVSLLGLSASEINGTPSEPFLPLPEKLLARLPQQTRLGLDALYARIFRGSMPALYAYEIDREAYYRAYVNTYLQRDLRDLTQVADEMSFFNFMTVVAARTARPVVYEEIAKDCGISAPTAKKWLSILVSSGIVALVQPYHNNMLKRVIKSPMLHFLDTGLCAYLLKWASPETLERGAMSGAFFESYVFAEIYKSYLNAGKEPPLYYYRDKDQKEIDLIIYQDGTLYPIEIKKSASPGRDASKHFRLLQPLTPGAIVCMAHDLLPLDKNAWLVPAWMI